MWPFGGGKTKGGVKGEAKTPALPGADAPIDLEAASLALSPISLRSGEDGGEIDTGDAALRSPAPPYLAEPDGGDHEAAERQQQARPSSGHAVAVPSLPANRPGTSGGSERGGDDRHSRPSSGGRSTRSLLPGETDNEEEAGLIDEPDDGHTRSRPGSAPRVLVPVEESLSNDERSPQRDDATLASLESQDGGWLSKVGMSLSPKSSGPMCDETPLKSASRPGTAAKSARGTSRGSSRSSVRSRPPEKNLKYMYLAGSGLCIVVIVVLAISLVAAAPRTDVCTTGEYYGKRLNATGSQATTDSCVPCPLGQSSDGGTGADAKCFCTSGYYTPLTSAPHTLSAPISPEKCVSCDRGLWTPAQVAIGRPTCQRYDEFWRLGAYGANCQTTCASFNMSFDAPGLRLWEQRFSMPDVLNMISFQIKVNCSSIALSWRTAGPFICSHPDCGAIYGTCYTPAAPIKDDASWVTPQIVRRFCPCYNAATLGV